MDLQTESIINLVCFETVEAGTKHKKLGKPKFVTLPYALCIQDPRARKLHRVCLS